MVTCGYMLFLLCFSGRNTTDSFAFLQVGNVGLWTVDENNDDDAADGVFQFKPHTGAVPRLNFDPMDSNKLISTSYDGTVRRMDVEKGAFEQVSKDQVLCMGVLLVVHAATKPSPHLFAAIPQRHVLPRCTTGVREQGRRGRFLLGWSPGAGGQASHAVRRRR